jgi:hypothetical protein
MLALALGLGGALAVARQASFGGDAHELGEALAGRMTCAARDACARERRAGPGGAAGGAHPGGLSSRLHHGRPRPRPGRPRPGRPRPGRPRPSASALGPFRGRGSPPTTRAGSGALELLGKAGRRAWILCLGFRRLRYDLDHPRTPRQAIPPGELLDEANTCLNPWVFLSP